MNDQLVAYADTYTTRNKYKRRATMNSVRFEPAILAIERLQSYALDRTATGIGFLALMISNTTENVHIQITKLLCFRKTQMDWASDGPKNVW